ncbi:ferredoxin [Micromonospora lupini]|uniref:ferredoxin n=1 Tax=Micromonospora lupini TaxID=285679 RepID=UPI00224D89FC|nr:ferredoxin [Micromonospora lupini]MCX5065758.1 ferredoxin [Micromonospora lupini]
MIANADRDICLGTGRCVMTAPALFDQDDDGMVVVLRQPRGADEDEDVREAVNLCPSGAISLNEIAQT